MKEGDAVLSWSRIIIHKKRVSLVLSVFDSGEELMAKEIAERLMERHGVDVKLQTLVAFIRGYMEHRYLKKVRKEDEEGNLRTYWRVIR